MNVDVRKGRIDRRRGVQMDDPTDVLRDGRTVGRMKTGGRKNGPDDGRSDVRFEGMDDWTVLSDG